MAAAGRHYENVLDWFGQQIEKGEISTGDRIPSERELASAFGMSRIPVREAYRIMEFLGIIGRDEVNGLVLRSETLGKRWLRRNISRAPAKKRYTNIEIADIVHQVTELYQIIWGERKDYGTGEIYGTEDVHFLKQVADYPGKDISYLAKLSMKTEDQMKERILRLVDMGLLEKSKDGEAGDIYSLTEKGRQLDLAHRTYDRIHFGESMNPVRTMYTEEEIDIAFEILETWLGIRRDIYHKENQANQESK